MSTRIPFLLSRRCVALALIALTATAAQAETEIDNAPALVIEGATIHSLAGAPEVGRIVISGGLIQAAGADADPTVDATVIDASGLHVYPGLFDAMTTLGLIEISSIAATSDATEIGRFNPQLEAASAVHPASQVIPVTRANGITHTLVAPATDQQGIIAGQAALLHLDGWTVDEMAIERSAAMVIRWPDIATTFFDRATFSRGTRPYEEAKERAEEAHDELRDWLDAARHYAQAQTSERVERNLELEALAQVLGGGLPVIFLTSAKRDIESAVAFAEREGLDMILAGGRDAWQVKELLAEKDIPVILGRTQSLPAEADDPYDRPFRTAAELHAAGVRFAFGTGAGGRFGPGGPHSSRTLPYESAMAAAYGLPREEALKAITANPAEIFGLGDRLGTITPGKIANLIVTDGDPLEITTQVHHVIINGRQADTNNRHRRLYEQYRSRPGRR
ncbi:MAG: amidohydrolase family protein [Acidobacteriota bacterium]